MIHIGRYEIYPVETGRFALDGGAMFGVVPRPLWEKTNPPDEKNRITPGRTRPSPPGGRAHVLVDTGNGGKFDEKLTSIYRIDTSGSDLVSSLARHGVSPEAVTDAYLCTLILTTPADRRIWPTGRRSRRSPAPATTSRPNTGGPPLPPRSGTGRVSSPTTSSPWCLARGAGVYGRGGRNHPGDHRATCARPHPGPAVPAHQRRPHKPVLCADLVPTSAHVPLPWIMAYDLRPLVTLEEKRRLLDTAADEGWIMFFEHDPVLAAARLARTDKGIVPGRTPFNGMRAA